MESQDGLGILRRIDSFPSFPSQDGSTFDRYYHLREGFVSPSRSLGYRHGYEVRGLRFGDDLTPNLMEEGQFYTLSSAMVDGRGKPKTMGEFLYQNGESKFEEYEMEFEVGVPGDGAIVVDYMRIYMIKRFG